LIRYDVLETPEHQQIRLAVKTLIQNNCTLWISRQVVREYCRVLTHPSFPAPLEMRQAVHRARQIIPFFKIADENEYVMQNLFVLLESVAIGGKQVHDANIVATMQSIGIKHLLTLNIADFKRFDSIITLIPLDDLLKPQP
jgi:predicted nucleic acid-binding protein